MKRVYFQTKRISNKDDVMHLYFSLSIANIWHTIKDDCIIIHEEDLQRVQSSYCQYMPYNWFTTPNGNEYVKL